MSTGCVFVLLCCNIISSREVERFCGIVSLFSTTRLTMNWLGEPGGSGATKLDISSCSGLSSFSVYCRLNLPKGILARPVNRETLLSYSLSVAMGGRAIGLSNPSFPRAVPVGFEETCAGAGYSTTELLLSISIGTGRPASGYCGF